MTKQDDPTGMRKGLTSYGDAGFSLFLRKAFIKGAGLHRRRARRGRSIGIANTGSGYNPCHGNAPQLIEAVKRGVMLAGGLPMEFPTISIHESFARPTSMYLRNLMSMDTEEMIRAQPMDAVVLIGGCDKTVPAQLMGAASAGHARDPARHRLDAHRLASRRARRRLHRLPPLLGDATAPRRSTRDEIDERQQPAGRRASGTCSVMGTASTMACVAEALGMAVPGGASPPAVTADRMRIAEQTGAVAVRDREERAHARQDPHREGVRERAARAARDRRLDQRRSSTSPRSPGALGIDDRPRRARRAWAARRRCWST